MAVVSPGRSALPVYQPAIPRIAEPRRRARNPIRFSGCRSGDSQYRLVRVTFDVGCRSLALDADYPIAGKLKITTDLATAENAGCVTCNGNAGHYRRSGDRLVSPSSAHMSSDIAAGKDRDCCGPRPSHREIRCERRTSDEK